MGCRMLSLRSYFVGWLAGFRLLCVLLIAFPFVLAENSLGPRMLPKTREEILHTFNAELVYIRTNFPMGKTGLKLKNGTITPSGDELQHLMSLWGPAAKPGDRARISDVTIKGDATHPVYHAVGHIDRQAFHMSVTRLDPVIGKIVDVTLDIVLK